ncbi:hypothetical protein ACVI3U_005027 [Sinorhizobium medicae]
MSSISASISRGKNSPIPGIVFNSFTLPLALVIARIVASDGLMRTSMSPMKARTAINLDAVDL